MDLLSSKVPAYKNPSTRFSYEIGVPVGLYATIKSDQVPHIIIVEPKTRLCPSSHHYTRALLRCRTISHSNSFIQRSASLWNSLPWLCFPPSYNLDCSYHQLPFVLFSLNNLSTCNIISRVALFLANLL